MSQASSPQSSGRMSGCVSSSNDSQKARPLGKALGRIWGSTRLGRLPAQSHRGVDRGRPQSQGNSDFCANMGTGDCGAESGKEADVGGYETVWPRLPRDIEHRLPCRTPLPKLPKRPPPSLDAHHQVWAQITSGRSVLTTCAEQHPRTPRAPRVARASPAPRAHARPGAAYALQQGRAPSASARTPPLAAACIMSERPLFIIQPLPMIRPRRNPPVTLHIAAAATPGKSSRRACPHGTTTKEGCGLPVFAVARLVPRCAAPSHLQDTPGADPRPALPRPHGRGPRARKR